MLRRLKRSRRLLRSRREVPCATLATPSAEYYTYDPDHTCLDAATFVGVCFLQGNACVACDLTDEYQRGAMCINGASCTGFSEFMTTDHLCRDAIACAAKSTPSAEYFTYASENSCIDATDCDAASQFTMGDACVACDQAD